MSLLLISEILVLFVNALNAHVKYYLFKMENFLESIQVQLFKKKNLSDFFYFFLKSK